MTKSTEEFDAGTSPCVNTDPRLPRQHTIDAHQLRVLHRAIDTLAFVAEQNRDAEAQRQDALGAWGRIHRGIFSEEDFTVSEYDLQIIRRSLILPALPRGVTKLIDATVGAWEPVKDELVAQTSQYQRGE